MKRRPPAQPPWLPDLCRLPRIALVLGAAEMVVLVVALAPTSAQGWNASRLVSASAFALWLGLTIAVLLCLLRGRLSRLPRALGAVAAVAMAGIVAAGGAAMLYVIDGNTGAHLIADDVSMVRFAVGSAAIAMLVVAALLRYLYAIEGWQAQLEASARAQAQALQARIRPHFLFNSMNTIASLVRSDPATAERAVLDLSDLFRAALGAGEGNSTLAEEVVLAERYLGIEQLRLGPRLQVAWQRTEPLPWQMPVPRLVLQPLLENAVLHGVSRLPEGGLVEVVLQRVGNAELRVRVRNPAPAPGAEASHHGAGHAQRSTLHRLQLALGPAARMSAGWREGYYVAELRLPILAASASRREPA